MSGAGRVSGEVEAEAFRRGEGVQRGGEGKARGGVERGETERGTKVEHAAGAGRATNDAGADDVYFASRKGVRRARRRGRRRGRSTKAG